MLLGRACYYSGQLSDAERSFFQARRLAGSDALLKGEALFMEGEAARRQGKHKLAIARFRRAEMALKSKDTPHSHELRAKCLFATSTIRRQQGRRPEAVRSAEKCLAEAEASADDDTLALAHMALFSSHTAAGDAEAAARFVDLPLRILRRGRARAGVLATFQNELAMAAYASGEWKQAASWYRQSSQAASSAGEVAAQALAASNGGEVLSDQGRLDEAEAAFHEALEIWRPARHLLGLAFISCNLGRLAARRGRTSEAETQLKSAAAQFLEMGLSDYAAITRCWLAEAYVFGGQDEQALAQARLASADLSKGPQGDRLRSLLERTRGVALAHLGHKQDALWALKESERLARKGTDEYELALTLRAREELAGLIGSAPARAGSEARRLLKRLGVVWVPPVLH